MGARAGPTVVPGLGDGRRLGLAPAGCELPAAAVPGDVAALADWAARALALCRPVTVISVALIAATTHSATAATNVTPGGSTGCTGTEPVATACYLSG